MARARIIKPGFFLNDDLADCEPLARLLFAGLWCHADREGRLEDRPRRLKTEILPYDDCDPDALLEQLAARGFVIRYEIGGGRYIQVTGFAQHQSPHPKEPESKIPVAKNPAEIRHAGESHVITRQNSEGQVKPDLGEHGMSTKTRPVPEFPEAAQPSIFLSSSFTNPSHSNPSLVEAAPSAQPEPPVAADPPAKQSRGTRIPEDWTPDANLMAWAAREFPRVDPELETGKFKRHFMAKAGRGATMLRWDLAWQNWISNSRATPGYVDPLEIPAGLDRRPKHERFNNGFAQLLAEDRGADRRADVLDLAATDISDPGDAPGSH